MYAGWVMPSYLLPILIRIAAMVLLVFLPDISAAVASEKPYGGGKMARLAKQVWDDPKNTKALDRFLNGQWQYIASAGFPRKSELTELQKKFDDSPEDYLGKIITFQPDRVDIQSLFPGLPQGTHCSKPRYSAEKMLYGQNDVPDKAFLWSSVTSYSDAIKEELPAQADDLKSFLPENSDESGWLVIKINTTCVRAQGKPREEGWDAAEITRGGICPSPWRAVCSFSKR